MTVLNKKVDELMNGFKRIYLPVEERQVFDFLKIRSL